MSIDEATNIDTLGLSLILILGILVLFLPRRLALVPIIIAACYITGQQLMLFVFHFSTLRIIILLAWIRLIVRGEIFTLKLNGIDKFFICWVVSSFVIYILQWQTSDALVNRLGFFYDSFGLYFYFRFNVRDFNDIERVLVVLAIIIIPVSIAMLFEQFTGRNIFSIFGGVSEVSVIRDGRIRSQGPFRHPILSGTFGATLVPVLLTFWFKEKKSRLLAVLGFFSASTIMATSASSGPLMTYVFGLLAFMFWPLRYFMRAIRWGILFILTTLHLVMQAPVWYIFSRLSDLIGGTGWHRSYLIDQAITHFGEWWLFGMKYTADWFPYGLAISNTATDITNQYIAEGVTGGLLTLILFVMIIISCFKTVGLSLKAMEERPFGEKIVVWSLGAALFAHMIALSGVGYFDQIRTFWFLLLALIATLGEIFNIHKRVQASASI